MHVTSADSEFTTLSLRCCGRFTEIHEFLYHHPDTIYYLGLLGGELPPFSAKGPYFPPGWGEPRPEEWRANPPDATTRVEKFGRFRLRGY